MEVRIATTDATNAGDVTAIRQNGPEDEPQHPSLPKARRTLSD